jgi:hypothetical protein
MMEEEYTEIYVKPIPVKSYKAKMVIGSETELPDVYREKDLVSFGNYLLSQKRKDTIINEENLDKVTDADLSNWKELNKQ